MIVLSWNCRGLGQPQTVNVICELVRTHKVSVVLLFETLAHSNKVEEVCAILGFESVFLLTVLEEVEEYECCGRSKERSKGTMNAVEKRLDRALVSSDWLHIFPTAKLMNLTAPISDHSPILLETSSCTERPVCSTTIQDKLFSCSIALTKWDRKLSRHFRVEASKLHGDIDFLEFKNDLESICKLKETKERLIKLLNQEEVYWKQKAKTY
ncbi:hypothetical protein PTKIN_Ptkin15bG0113100 [Pterospermum kingtungense]